MYVPGAVLLAIHICVIYLLQPSELLRWNLDRVEWIYLAMYFVAATYTLWHSYRHAESAILRQQMKWVTRGTILSVAPFTCFYIIPYLFGAVPGLGMKVSVLSLVFLPLTFGYAIFRYRLMDVDLIFKRGMAYTIAAGAITAAYFASVGMASVLFHQNFPNIGPIGLVVAIAVTALLFDPFKNWVQEYLDKFFYRKRYDYRKTLIEFGRDLNSETDLDKMLSSIVDRLSRTLLVDRIAIFVADPDQPEQFYLAKSYGISDTSAPEFRLPARRAAGVGSGPPVLRQHQPGGARDALGARDHPTAGAELLHSLHGHESHDRRAGHGQDLGRRFPLQRRRPAAGDAGRLHRHRRAERASVQVAGRESGPVRAAERVQREHRRVDQCRRDGGRSRRPHRVVELADGSDVRAARVPTP